MNVNTNKKPLATIRGFKGLWARGADSQCPAEFLVDCYNCSFPGPGQISIREPYTVQNDIETRTIISFAVATLAVNPILITLSSDGKLFDETSVTLLGTFVGADDFVCLSIYGRCYISLKQGGKAYAGGQLYWYDGTTFSTASCPAPLTQVTLTQPDAGVVTIGTHQFGVAYESPTGALSKLNPIASIASDGSHNVHIADIPTGPAGTVARVLVASPANSSELFFIPGGRIADNTTTVMDFNLADSALIDSADYLFNLLYPVPSCAAIKFYKGRLVLIGRDTTPDEILVSNQAAPEEYNLVNNVVNLPKDYGWNTASGGMILRDVLYITKPNATYSVQDNGDNPNTWSVSIVDSGIGGFDCAISVFASSMSAQDVMDSCLVANKRGLMFFNGTYGQLPLTYNIERLWQKINQNAIDHVQIAHDIWQKRVYIAVPLIPPTLHTTGRITTDPGGANNVLLMMDYQDGLVPQAVKWTVWTPGGPYKKIAVENFLLNYGVDPIIYQFAFCRGDSTILKITPSDPGENDQGLNGTRTAIGQQITTSLIVPGGLCAFSGINIIFSQGQGTLTPATVNKNRSAVTARRTFSLGAYAAYTELFRGINHQDFGMSVMLWVAGTVGAGSQAYINLEALEVYGTVMYPQLLAGLEST